MMARRALSRAFSSRRSGLQSDVLALYREALRLARRKEREAGDASGATYAHARERFRQSAASVRRMDFQRIEFLLRQVGGGGGVCGCGTRGCTGTRALRKSRPPSDPRRPLSLSRSLCSRQGRKQIDLLGMDGARGAVGVRVPSGVAGKS